MNMEKLTMGDTVVSKVTGAVVGVIVDFISDDSAHHAGKVKVCANKLSQIHVYVDEKHLALA